MVRKSYIIGLQLRASARREGKQINGFHVPVFSAGGWIDEKITIGNMLLHSVILVWMGSCRRILDTARPVIGFLLHRGE